MLKSGRCGVGALYIVRVIPLGLRAEPSVACTACRMIAIGFVAVCALFTGVLAIFYLKTHRMSGAVG